MEKVKKILQKKISTLKEADVNARVHSEEQIDQIAASMAAYGFTQPILIDEKNILIAGHGRLAAAKRLNMESVPCIVLSHLTPDQKRAYAIADNKISLNSKWDEEILKTELAGLQGDDIDLSLLGFSEFELNTLLTIDDEDMESLSAGDGESSTGEQGDVLRVLGHQIPLDTQDKALLKNAIEGYLAENGTLFGFAGKLIQGKFNV